MTRNNREQAISFLYGETELTQLAEEEVCIVCKGSIPPKTRAIFVKPRGQGEVVGPFCRFFCKVRHESRAIAKTLIA